MTALRVVADRNIPGLPAALSELAAALGRPLALDVLPAARIDADAVREAELLFTRSTVRCAAPLLDGSRVRFVATATIGTDHMDLRWLEAQGITWTSAPGSNADSVQQWFAAALCAAAPGLLLRAFAGESPRAGVVGVGNVGSRVARLLRALGFTVLCCDPPRQRREDGGESGDFVDLPTLCAACELVTLHVPLTRAPDDDATEGFFSTAALSRLPPGALLCNASRGEVLDAAAALSSLRSSQIGALLLDVFPGEPRPAPDLVAAAAVATPHIAGHSLEGKVNGTLMVYRAACAFLGVPATFQPGPDLLPPPPLDGLRLIPPPGLSAPEAALTLFQQAVTASYDLRADDHALRQITKLPESAQAAAFRAYRDAYPVRRQLHGARLALPAATDPAAARLRAALTVLGASV